MMCQRTLTNILNSNLPALSFVLKEAEDFDQEDHEIEIHKHGKSTSYSVQHGPFGTTVNKTNYRDGHVYSVQHMVTGIEDYTDLSTGACETNKLIRDIRRLDGEGLLG